MRKSRKEPLKKTSRLSATARKVIGSRRFRAHSLLLLVLRPPNSGFLRPPKSHEQNLKMSALLRPPNSLY
jgi:hypothetical protein